MLEGKGLIIHMVLAMYSILTAVLKWRPANGVVCTFAKLCVKSIFQISSDKTSNTFQLIQISDAMRPEDDSCMDKVKEMYPDQNSSTLKVGYLYKKINKTDIPSGSVLESIPKCLHKSP